MSELSATDDPVEGFVTLHHFGYVRMTTCAAGPLRFGRGHAADDAVALLLPREGSVHLSQDGRTVSVESEQVALVDLRRDFSVEVQGRILDFRLPSHALHVPAASLRSATARVPTSSTAPLTLVLRHLEESASHLPAQVGERLGGMVTDLVAGLVHELAEEADGLPQPGRRHLVLAVRQYIERHLDDPELSAERIARAHLISVRYLHRLFEGEGITVGRLIQRLRVEHCARELARRGRVSPSIAVVAARWGFRSAAHFSRAFKAVHGCSPQQWRRAAGTG
ncbi:helix-turn-helix domain-containing protein [Streptomyces sp. NBC_00287]|uniref:helix-turn-helix domain-containing protein n=1 Tax=Streptomyces sp. NBC_00287 TaxID=2975702 RepID=UPI002E27F189|nr:helix-turn-helix domain-containing protein [Streptomyces sp. NBC_00287]